jgi:glycosyltransferase involved in cell wall biosynthesis
MIFFDATKTSTQKHHSGLRRLAGRVGAGLEAECPGGVVRVAWRPRRRGFADVARGEPVRPGPRDWLLTTELFCEEERPGFTEWLARRPCRCAAVYNDAIPLRFPEITWARSVARHPGYMRLLAGFDRVLASSEASAAELREFHRWAGRGGPDPVAIPLGADGLGLPRSKGEAGRRAGSRVFATVGIVEPRKDQNGILDAAEALWAEGVSCEVWFAGRVNSELGEAVAKRLRRAQKTGRPVRFVEHPGDDAVAELLGRARCLVQPSLAEGCGLPVLEALWAGAPVLCSDIPAHAETARAGGCLLVPPGNTAALAAAMRRVLEDDALVERMAGDAAVRPLPVWADTVRAIRKALEG